MDLLRDSHAHRRVKKSKSSKYFNITIFSFLFKNLIQKIYNIFSGVSRYRKYFEKSILGERDGERKLYLRLSVY